MIGPTPQTLNVCTGCEKLVASACSHPTVVAANGVPQVVAACGVPVTPDWCPVLAPAATTITVNNKTFVVASTQVAYEEIVSMAGMKSQTRPTVTYYCRTSSVQGSLIPDQTIGLIPNLIFNVTHTSGA